MESSPPPPANQIIHVGVARTEMCDAGYRLKAVRVETYKAR